MVSLFVAGRLRPVYSLYAVCLTVLSSLFRAEQFRSLLTASQDSITSVHSGLRLNQLIRAGALLAVIAVCLMREHFVQHHITPLEVELESRRRKVYEKQFGLFFSFLFFSVSVMIQLHAAE